MEQSNNKDTIMSSMHQKVECSDHKEITELKVDVGVLKAQTSILSQLCEKMDKVIEKLVENQDKHINQVYREMDKKRLETDEDISELHDRIDMVLEKVQDTERRLLEGIHDLRIEVNNNNKAEKEKLDKLLEWRWMIGGGIIAVSWLISHFNGDIIRKFL